MSAVLVSLGFAVLYLAGVVGYHIGKRVERLRKPESVRAICPCTHSIGEHDSLGRCLAQKKRDLYGKAGIRLGDYLGQEYVACPCIKYYGPTPISEIFNSGTYVDEA